MVTSDVLNPGIFAAAQEIGGFNLLAPYVLQLSSRVYFNLDEPANLTNSDIRSASMEEILQKSSPGDSIYVAASIDNRETQTVPLYEHSQKKGIEFLISLDNWVYFPERLGDLGPCRLIVYDSFAFNYAKKVFGEFHDVLQVENFYLKEIISKVKSLHREENTWLFLDARPNDYTIFDHDLHEIGCCCSQISDLIKNGNKVTFRPHPGYFRKSCLDYLTKKDANLFRISQEKLLSKDLYTHSHVLGSPGYALYVAEMVGKKVFATASTNSFWNGPVFERLLSSSL